MNEKDNNIQRQRKQRGKHSIRIRRIESIWIQQLEQVASEGSQDLNQFMQQDPGNSQEWEAQGPLKVGVLRATEGLNRGRLVASLCKKHIRA